MDPIAQRSRGEREGRQRLRTDDPACHDCQLDYMQALRPYCGTRLG